MQCHGARRPSSEQAPPDQLRHGTEGADRSPPPRASPALDRVVPATSLPPSPCCCLRFLCNEQRHVRQAPASPVPARSRETSASPAPLTASLPVSLARAGLACPDPPPGPLSSRACGPTPSKASVPCQAASSTDLGQAHGENPPFRPLCGWASQIRPMSRFFPFCDLSIYPGKTSFAV